MIVYKDLEPMVAHAQGIRVKGNASTNPCQETWLWSLDDTVQFAANVLAPGGLYTRQNRPGYCGLECKVDHKGLWYDNAE